MAIESPSALRTLTEGEQWWRKVRRSRVQPRAAGRALSSPIPGEREGSCTFFHSAQNADGTQRRILSRITAALPELKITEYRRADDADLFPGLPTSMAPLPMSADPDARRALFAIYPLCSSANRKSSAGPGRQFLGLWMRLRQRNSGRTIVRSIPTFSDWLRRGSPVRTCRCAEAKLH